MLANAGCLLSSRALPFPILLLHLIEHLKFITLIPGMPLIVYFRVISDPPSALFRGGAGGGPSLWGFAVHCCCVGLVVVCLRGDVHEPLAAPLIGEVVLCHQIVLDVGH